MTEERVRRCIDQGMSVVVGSVNAEGVPVSCRAMALVSADDLSTVTVYVPLATSQETIANVATTRRMAVTSTHAVDHASIQLKGTAVETRLARADEEAIVRRGIDSFGEVLAQIGIPRRVTRAVTCWPAFAIQMKVEEIYDQTP